MSSVLEELYQKLLGTGLSEGELEAQIKKKAKEYGGFISEQGVLFIIAKEYGLTLHSPKIDPELYKELEEEVDYEEFTIDISEVREGMSNIVLLGKVLKIYESHTFSRKDGSSGTVGSFLIGDPSGMIKVVIWDEMATLMKNEFFQVNILVRIIGGYSKMGSKERIEVHLGKKGKILVAPEDVSPQKQKLFEILSWNKEAEESKPKSSSHKIKELIDEYNFLRKVQGIVRIEEFKEITKKDGEKTFLLRFFLEDDTMTVRVIVWGMMAIECLKSLENDATVEISNVFVKENTYTSEKELIFTKKSSLVVIG